MYELYYEFQSVLSFNLYFYPGIDSKESIPGLLKCLQIWALMENGAWLRQKTLKYLRNLLINKITLISK